MCSTLYFTVVPLYRSCTAGLSPLQLVGKREPCSQTCRIERDGAAQPRGRRVELPARGLHPGRKQDDVAVVRGEGEGAFDRCSGGIQLKLLPAGTGR